jgi:photosystem II stability/assembly factor-like uncharacterized protein
MNRSARGLWLQRQLVLGLGALALTAVALAGAGKWTGSGPAGAKISGFAADPSMPERVYALGSHGLLRSTDGGASWVNVNAHTGNLAGRTLTVSISSAIYALSVWGQVVRSDDEGVTWLSFDPHLGTNDRAISLAVDPSSGSTLYLGSLRGVFKSTDGGETWASTSGLPLRVVNALAIDPSRPSTIYAATSNPDYAEASAGVFKSTDAGRSWALVGPSTAYVTCLAINPAGPIYGCGAPGAVRSDDHGVTWKSLLSGHSAYLIAIDPRDSSSIYAATPDGLFHLNDYGAWSHVRFGPGAREDVRVSAMTILPSSPTVLLVAARDGILRSTDGGGNWTVADAPGRASIQSLALDPSAPGSLYAGGEGGAFKSANAGASWTPASLTTPATYALAADPSHPSTVYAGGHRVSKTTDGGATWRATGDGFSGLWFDGMSALAVAPSDSSVILAGNQYGRVFKTVDGGEHWQQTGRLSQVDYDYPPRPASFAFDSSSSTTAYTGCDLGLYGESSGGIFKTVDGGMSWVDLGVGHSGVVSVVADPESPSTIYAATRDGLIKSVDAGATWISMVGPAGVLLIDPVEPTTIYSGGKWGVYWSLDAGVTWARLGPELTETTSL